MARSREEDEAQLTALAQQRDAVVTLIGPPGVGKSWQAGTRASLEEVIADGWPGERIHAEAAAHRAYMAISTLRRMGLRDRLRSVGDGYELVGGVSLVDAR